MKLALTAHSCAPNSSLLQSQPRPSDTLSSLGSGPTRHSSFMPAAAPSTMRKRLCLDSCQTRTSCGHNIVQRHPPHPRPLSPRRPPPPPGPPSLRTLNNLKASVQGHYNNSVFMGNSFCLRGNEWQSETAMTFEFVHQAFVAIPNVANASSKRM